MLEHKLKKIEVFLLFLSLCKVLLIKGFGFGFKNYFQKGIKKTFCGIKKGVYFAPLRDRENEVTVM